MNSPQKIIIGKDLSVQTYHQLRAMEFAEPNDTKILETNQEQIFCYMDQSDGKMCWAVEMNGTLRPEDDLLKQQELALWESSVGTKKEVVVDQLPHFSDWKELILKNAPAHWSASVLQIGLFSGQLNIFFF